MENQKSMRRLRRHLKEQDIASIITLSNYGMKIADIVQITNVSQSTVGYVIRANFFVVNEDWESAKDMLHTKASSWKYLEYSANQNNIAIPDDVYAARQEGLEYAKNARKKDYEDVEEVDECAFPIDEFMVEEEPTEEEPPEEEPMKSRDNNDVLYFVKLLELLRNTNELLEQLMDVVIPKYACDVKDNFNVNFDLVCERLKGCEDKLEKVVYNTRKRGN